MPGLSQSLGSRLRRGTKVKKSNIEFEGRQLDQFTDSPKIETPDYLKLSSYPDASPLFKNYIATCDYVHTFVESPTFSNLVVITIFLAGVLIGVQTYDSMEGNMILSILDWIVLSIFILEIFLKLIACGPYPQNYFIGTDWKWNNFDFFVVLLSLPFWGVIFSSGSSNNESIAVLRMFRLMRLMKLVRKVPQLQMIVMGLLGGLTSIGYILLLLFLGLFCSFIIFIVHIFIFKIPPFISINYY